MRRLLVVSIVLLIVSMPRYFISVADSMPIAYATWSWAQGFAGNSSTFYYQLAGSPAGGPYYTYRSADRAFILADASPAPPAPRSGGSPPNCPPPARAFRFSRRTPSVSLPWVSPAIASIPIASPPPISRSHSPRR